MTSDAVATAPLERGGEVVPSIIVWRDVIRIGLIGGAIALYLCLVGIVPVFHQRQLIAGVITLGQVALFGSMALPGAFAARKATTLRDALLTGAAAGLITGLAVTLLVVVGSVVDLRAMFLNASPELYSMLTMGMGTAGAWIPAVEGLLLGALAGAIGQLPDRIRSPLVRGLLAVLVVGLFAGLLRAPLLSAGLGSLSAVLFTSDGLTVVGAVLVFSIVVLGRVVRQRVGVAARIAALPDERRQQLRIPAIAGLVAIVLILPLLLGPFFAQVIALVALYILMAFGLNITLGLAGLLDLGFVAFFAVGAYTVGLFTSTAEYGLLDIPFWLAVPFAMLFAAIFGAILGLPILSIRGDYLAIATLGFGEIIRLLAGSNLLLPLLGGPRGIINIPKPFEVPSTSFFSGPSQIYYIALAFAVVVAFIAWRLRNGRIGRAWIAIREDEDVAEAVGINLIQTKLLAYVLGAAFAGLGGAVFAGLVGSIFPSSINLFVSINVAAIVIVGGMGSIPGVALGALFLIGIPELFREFADYRFLFYGMALIGMMLYRPEGIWPSGIARRELHVEDESQVILAGDTTPITRGRMS
jgi:branched-chain amino acid transport system permease protein